MDLTFIQRLVEYAVSFLLAQTILASAIIFAFSLSRDRLSRQSRLRRSAVYAAAVALALAALFIDARLVLRAPKLIAGNPSGASPQSEGSIGRNADSDDGTSQGRGSSGNRGASSRIDEDSSSSDDMLADGDDERAMPIFNIPPHKIPLAAKESARVPKGSHSSPADTPDSQKTSGSEALEQAKKLAGSDNPGSTTDGQDVGETLGATERRSVENKPQANGKATVPDATIPRDKSQAGNKPGDKGKSEADDKSVEMDKPDAGNQSDANDKADVPGKPDAPDKDDKSDRTDKSGIANDGSKVGERGEPDGIDKAKIPDESDGVPGTPDGTALNLQSKPGKTTDPDASDDKHAGKNAGKEGVLSLATKQDGKPDEKLAAPVDKTSAASPLKQPTENTALLPTSLIPSALTAPSPVAEVATANAAKPSERPKLEGSLPPFRYSGATQELFKKYPRMEVAWALDREPGGKEPPKVVLEVVLDADGEVHWRNLQSEQCSRFFKDATVSYVLRERIVASSPNQLRLGRESTLISKALIDANLTSVPPARMTWGYYRHQAEAYELSRAARAFQEAAGRDLVSFEPQRDDYLEIRWAADSQGDVSVSRARFCPEKGDTVNLVLPRE